MKYHRLESIEKQVEPSHKFANDLTLEYKSLTRSKFPIQSNTPLLPTYNSDFLRITTDTSIKLKGIEQDMRELEELLKKSSFFLNNDVKVSDMTIKIKESLSEVQFTIGSLKSEPNHDLTYNSSSEQLSKAILEILQLRALKQAESFQKILKIQAEDFRKREEKMSNFKPGYRIPSENLRNRPMFLETSSNHDDKGVVHQNDSDSENLKYDREVRKVDQSRKESIKNIERLLHEVGRTFQRLGTMVKMQEIMVDRIDKDLDHTELNISMGKENLMKYYENVSSNRKLCFQVLAILFLFGVVYILFLA